MHHSLEGPGTTKEKGQSTFNECLLYVKPPVERTCSRVIKNRYALHIPCVIITEESGSFSASQGYPSSFHTAHVGSISDTATMLRGVSTWRTPSLGSCTHIPHFRRCRGEKAERTDSEHAILHSLHLSGHVLHFKHKCKLLVISNCHWSAM